MSLGKYFDGCIACENAFCSTAFFEEGIRIIIGFEALERNVIENAELPLQKFLDGNHEVWRRSTHLYFDLTFVALCSLLTRPQD